MAGVKSNGLLKYLVPIVVGAAIFVGVYAYKGRSVDKNIQTRPDSVVYDLTESEQQELGITAGDTPHDTLKTLLGTVKDTKSEVKAVREQNEKLKQENNFLKSNANNVAQQISEALEQKQYEFNQQLAALRNEMATLPKNESTSTTTQADTAQNYPIGGIGLDGSTSQGQKSFTLAQQEPETKWVDPSDVIYKDKNGNIVDSSTPGANPAMPNPFKVLDESAVGDAAKQIQSNPSSARDEKNNVVPFFTVPQNSTLIGSTSMTALIGRVPIDGNVTDPYPFKIMIGRDNLISNGIELPDVEGAIVSGTATGDWTLSCVKGKVESITFVFSDGRISNAQERNNNQNDKGIGWLSNPNGVPCLVGERKTNAPEYLASQFLLSGASAAAQGLAQGQTTTVVDGASVIGAVTGNQGKFILGQALGGGLKETADWFRQRYGQTFDAVYVPPGQPVAVHITQELKIDYNPSGRKVKYQHSRSTRHLD